MMRKVVETFYEALIGAGLSLCVAACAGSPSTPAVAKSSEGRREAAAGRMRSAEHNTNPPGFD
jgi:hypothetical protein